MLMLVAPRTSADLDGSLPRATAEQVARNWWMLLLDGIVLIVAGILIFSIDWSVRSLATFIGALFVMQGLVEALTAGVDPGTRRVNVVTGLLSVAAGIAIVVWPGPGLLAVGIFLGAWLIVTGTLTIAGALAARRILPSWWLLLILGLLEVPLGVLALADPGTTLAALVTVAGIWAVAIGVLRVILAFELRSLPEEIDRRLRRGGDGASSTGTLEPQRFARSRASYP
jgi:uncharacterized membrane protein HdeD (DUF308 family)